MHETETLGAKELVLGYAYESGRAYAANYLQLIVSRGLRHERRVTWDTTAGDVDALLDCATHSSKSGKGSGALLDLEAECGCIALVWVASGVAAVHLAAETFEALAAGESLLRQRLPERVATEDQTVPVAFWSHAAIQPEPRARSTCRRGAISAATTRLVWQRSSIR